jgi:FtsP/CotA-like multicopper oxidase with cupredoxin domain
MGRKGSSRLPLGMTFNVLKLSVVAGERIIAKLPDTLSKIKPIGIDSAPALAALARFGKGRTVSDLGWKDTVLVWPGETVRIAVDFTHDYPGAQTYVFHCHNLEHADAGMMVNYRVQA